ncbi:hypothetical protein JCM33374_g6280 [Metschnikowia sp. JCM 33374]|nr:hypothetical protein JCM33374_g6280 [Metschnikowia sp. JCM 33374]
MPAVREICSHYAERDIFNMDESALYYKKAPEYSQDERQSATNSMKRGDMIEGKTEIRECVTSFLEERGGRDEYIEETCMESSEEDYESFISHFDELTNGQHSDNFLSNIRQTKRYAVELIEARKMNEQN